MRALVQEAYNKCFDIIAEEVPLYPLFHKKVLTGYWADKIEGFEPARPPVCTSRTQSSSKLA